MKQARHKQIKKTEQTLNTEPISENSANGIPI